jgi:hypothetical protein
VQQGRQSRAPLRNPTVAILRGDGATHVSVWA